MKNKPFQMALALIFLCATAGVALANPITSVLTEARQVAGTTHVEIRLYEHGDICSGAEPPCVAPTKILRDDTVEVSTDALATSTDDVDGGSGLGEYFGQRFCDCDVPAGKHSWHFQVNEDTESQLEGRYLDLGAFLTVTEPEDSDTPDTSSPCVDYCAPAPTADGDGDPELEADATDGDEPDGDAADADGDSDVASTEDDDNGGCAATAASAKWLLALLALFAMTFYRRKRSMR